MVFPMRIMPLHLTYSEVCCMRMVLYSDAEPLLVEALKIDEKVLGANHPNLARDLKSLAELYYALVRFEEADKLMVRANKIAQK